MTRPAGTAGIARHAPPASWGWLALAVCVLASCALPGGAAPAGTPEARGGLAAVAQRAPTTATAAPNSPRPPAGELVGIAADAPEPPPAEPLTANSAAPEERPSGPVVSVAEPVAERDRAAAPTAAPLAPSRTPALEGPVAETTTRGGPSPSPAAPAAPAPRERALAPPNAQAAGDIVAAPALVALVEQHLRDLRGVFGVAIKSLDSGQGALLNADRPFPAASLFKLPVMYEVYRQRDAGRLSLAEPLTLSARYAEWDLGTLDVPIGTTLTVESALRRMITISDNATANLLADRVGWSNLNATVRDLGLRETRLGGAALTTSPRDMLRLLELLARGEGSTPASSAEMVDLLLDQRVNDRLPAQLPAGARVAHKTGNLEGIVHDVGIVYAPGAPFLIALLAEDAYDYAQVARAQAALTRAVYDYFVTASGGPPPAGSPTLTPPRGPAGLPADSTPAPLTSPVALPPPAPPLVPTARPWQPPPPTARPWQSPTPSPIPAGTPSAS